MTYNVFSGTLNPTHSLIGVVGKLFGSTSPCYFLSEDSFPGGVRIHASPFFFQAGRRIHSTRRPNLTFLFTLCYSIFRFIDARLLLLC